MSFQSKSVLTAGSEVKSVDTSEKIDVTLKQHIQPGKCVSQFNIFCAVCKKHYSELSETKDKFFESIGKDWKITVEHGWTHIKCCKSMPNIVKFT